MGALVVVVVEGSAVVVLGTLVVLIVVGEAVGVLGRAVKGATVVVLGGEAVGSVNVVFGGGAVTLGVTVRCWDSVRVFTVSRVIVDESLSSVAVGDGTSDWLADGVWVKATTVTV